MEGVGGVTFSTLPLAGGGMGTGLVGVGEGRGGECWWTAWIIGVDGS